MHKYTPERKNGRSVPFKLNWLIPRRTHMKTYMGLLIALFLLYAYFLGDYGLIQLVKREMFLHDLQYDIEQLAQEEASLQEQLNTLKTKDLKMIEKIAREQYGMVKQGQQLFKVQYQNTADQKQEQNDQ